MSTRSLSEINNEFDAFIKKLGQLEYNHELQKAEITETVLKINKLHQERHEAETSAPVLS